MVDTKELRRLAQAATPGPDGVSLSWIRLLRDFQQGASPAAISELLDRLEAAEKERDALRIELNDIRYDAAHQKALAESALRVAEGWEGKCGELRAALRHEADCVDAAKAKIDALPGAQPTPSVPDGAIDRLVALPARITPEQVLNMAINAGEHLLKHLPNDEFLTEADRMAVDLLEKAKRFERGE